MHRVRATEVRTGKPIDIDLDEAALIFGNGELNESDGTGRILKTHKCTLIRMRVTGNNGQMIVEGVVETPDELYELPVLQYRPRPPSSDVKPIKFASPKAKPTRRAKK